MSDVKGEIREIVSSAWVAALRKALTSAVPESSDLNIAEETDKGWGESELDVWSWYSQSLGQPSGATIWAGAAAESWTTLINSLLTAQGEATGPERVESICMDIVAATNNIWAEKLKRRYGKPCEFGDAARSTQPEGLRLMKVSVTAALLPYPIMIGYGFEESLIGYLSGGADGDAAAPRQLPSSISDLHLDLYARLGSATLPLERVLNLNIGSILDIGRSTNDLVDVIANGKVIARGQVIAAKGNYAIKISRIAPG